MPPTHDLPAWRRGWTWTLIKCSAIILATSAAATMALYWLLRDLIGRLPGWVPGAIVERLFRWLFGHVWLLGPIVGLALGVLVSLGVIWWDARKGRLTRLS